MTLMNQHSDVAVLGPVRNLLKQKRIIVMTEIKIVCLMKRTMQNNKKWKNDMVYKQCHCCVSYHVLANFCLPEITLKHYNNPEK